MAELMVLFAKREHTSVRDTFYLVGVLLAAAILLFLGRDLLQGSLLITSALTFGGATAIAVLVLLLYRVSLELKASRHELARKEAELNFAREVQDALFPKTLPTGRGLEFHGLCLPARGISGDYYDAIDLADGRQVFAIADISGKGISAAILMANLQALLRREVLAGAPPGELTETLNRHFHQVSPPTSFATFFYGEWNPTHRSLSFVNAGHNRPMLFRRDNVRSLSEGGFPIGMFSDSDFTTGRVVLRCGDLLVLYSDGITEALSGSGEEYGEDRLEHLIAGMCSSNNQEVVDAIIESIKNWAGDDPDDDMTLLVIRVVGDGGRERHE